MRWFWFTTFTLICSLLSVFFRQPLVLIGELLLIDIFLTRKVRWFFWMPATSRHFPGWLNFLFWIVFTIWIIRVLAIDSITVHTPANKPQSQPGDNILISKIHFGPRLPMSAFGLSLPYFRLSGLSTIKRGDLLAYNFPEGDSVIAGMGSFSYYSLKRKRETEKSTLLPKTIIRYRPVDRRDPEVSRCIGLPGDTIIINADRYATVSAGFSPQAPAKGIAYNYLVEVRNRQLPEELLTRLGLSSSEIQVLPGLGYLIPLQADQVEQVRQRPEVIAVSVYLEEIGKGDYNIFPHDVRYPWNRDNFGPVIVPRKGDSIRLTLLNLCVYQRIIEVYEKNHLEISQDQIFINGSSVDSYVFKKDYFFVLGDNRHHSRDSRHWGFLPEDHIIGKPALIWFSATKFVGKPFSIYWNRIFNTPK